MLDSIERLEVFPDSGSLTPDDWQYSRGFLCLKKGRIIQYQDTGRTIK